MWTATPATQRVVGRFTLSVIVDVTQSIRLRVSGFVLTPWCLPISFQFANSLNRASYVRGPVDQRKKWVTAKCRIYRIIDGISGVFSPGGSRPAAREGVEGQNLKAIFAGFVTDGNRGASCVYICSRHSDSRYRNTRVDDFAASVEGQFDDDTAFHPLLPGFGWVEDGWAIHDIAGLLNRTGCRRNDGRCEGAVA